MKESPKLLVIDDEQIIINSVLNILKRTGYVIDSVNSGEDGLAKAEKKHYDVIITDLKMPGISGLDVLKRIKTKNPDQVVIVFTGYADVTSARQSLKLGAFDYIPKPFTPEELRDVITNALKSRSAKGDTKMLDLMTIVAHEFKSPVATVHTTADTLYGGYFGNLTPEQNKVLETIKRNCQYLEDIIRCYIDYTKMELEGFQFFKQNINFITDVIEPVVSTPEYQANMKRMKFICRMDEIPEISADPNLLKIIINNLVNNALKYGEPATDITISVRRQEKSVLFSIHNQGVGITEEDIENRLFKRFERLKQKGLEGIKGSGLGLYICKLIVDKHEGEIKVLSEVGEYTEFQVFLPIDA